MDRVWRRSSSSSCGDDDIADLIDPGSHAWVDHRGGGWFLDDRRSMHRHSRSQSIPLVDSAGQLSPFVVEHVAVALHMHRFFHGCNLFDRRFGSRYKPGKVEIDDLHCRTEPEGISPLMQGVELVVHLRGADGPHIHGNSHSML